MLARRALRLGRIVSAERHAVMVQHVPPEPVSIIVERLNTGSRGKGGDGGKSPVKSEIPARPHVLCLSLINLNILVYQITGFYGNGIIEVWKPARGGGASVGTGAGRLTIRAG